MTNILNKVERTIGDEKVEYSFDWGDTASLTIPWASTATVLKLSSLPEVESIREDEQYREAT
jgi:hypothetical protein